MLGVQQAQVDVCGFFLSPRLCKVPPIIVSHRSQAMWPSHKQVVLVQKVKHTWKTSPSLLLEKLITKHHRNVPFSGTNNWEDTLKKHAAHLRVHIGKNEVSASQRCTHIHCCFIPRTQEAETTQQSVDESTDEENHGVYT